VLSGRYLIFDQVGKIMTLSGTFESKVREAAKSKDKAGAEAAEL
jgi:hypothetical protein